MKGGPATPRRSQRPPPPPRRAMPAWLRRAVVVMRLLVLACALQLSGGSHVLVGALCGPEAACIDDCAAPGAPSEDTHADHRCPPGCPDCACPHGRLPSLPPSLALVVPERFAWEINGDAIPYRAGVPPSPPLPALDRPPRA